MATNERITDLPEVTNSDFSDVIVAVQGYVSESNPGLSVQETLQQVFNLFLSGTILHNAGDPNGSVEGKTYQLCWDTSNSILYVCTTTGSSVTAVWTKVSDAAGITPPLLGGTGVSNPTAHGIAVAEGASNFTFKTLTNGQVLIGSTGVDPVAATITGGDNITVSTGAGTITISTNGVAGFGWNEVTGTSQAMLANNGYVSNNGSLVSLSLPTTSAFGDVIAVSGNGVGGWSITQAASQQVHVGSVSSTLGAGGSISSTNRYDSIRLVCLVANTIWTTDGAPQGILTIV